MEKAIGTRQGHGPEAPSGYPSPPPARPPEHTPEFPEEQGKARTPFPVLHGLPGSPSETLQYMLRKVLFIYNPSSGESPVAGRFDRIIELYQAHGLHMLFHRLAFDAGDEAVLAAVDGSFDHLLLAGGDGSINYAVNLIKGMGLNLPVAVLPAGTANDFATLLGMPTDIEEACRAILAGRIHAMDLGRANGRYFANVFSCGLFTDVSQKTPTAWKNNLGKIAYYINGIGDLPRFRKMELSITSDGGDFRGNAIIFFVFNGRTAGTLPLAYLSEGDDGLLDILVLKGDTPLDTLHTAIRYLPRLLHRRRYPEGIVHIRCGRLHAECDRDEHTDVDGQPGPSFPIDITCEHGALPVILPDRKR